MVYLGILDIRKFAWKYRNFVSKMILWDMYRYFVVEIAYLLEQQKFFFIFLCEILNSEKSHNKISQHDAPEVPVGILSKESSIQLRAKEEEVMQSKLQLKKRYHKILGSLQGTF